MNMCGAAENSEGMALPRRSIHAFTLVELLTVVGIMGVLSMVVASGYRYLRDRAVDQKLRSHLMALRAANAQAQQDTGCTFPVVYYLSYSTAPPTGYSVASDIWTYCTIPPGSWRGPYISGQTDWNSPVPGFSYTYSVPPSSKGNPIYISSSIVSSDGTAYSSW